ncbi:cytokine receptor family member b1 [Periophthalmus magnuspinnatus]|uniref:cytokine receptor family member b1 n=1 Tax=Periophthalmus magnuspinnatus TaxID=409849 RepID=UPI0024368A22|nr:cytokine receptor family member b1 [Periophthalmus magnuspinnatus]XP_055086714.1 cytokine receptor family member b1 [Periophthalmus magnuspinnatus]XP_055086715.1 cytokine receptor family member b1 [Periophthalmus magnuspinnatus]
MNLLLLACLMVCLCTALVPPAPHSLYMWSFNFRHVLHWTAAPGSPPGLEYHVYNRCQGDKVGTTKKTWAAVQLKPEDKYRLCVRSHFNMTLSPPSKIISFTPFLKTNITAPNLTISGCGTCIQMNISLPKPHHTSGLQDIRDIYRDISFNVSLMKKGQETRTFTETKSQTVVLQYLSPGTEYCVQVEPRYQDIIFQHSSWTCVFTSPARSSVFAGMVSVAVLVVFLLLAVGLVFFGLQYTGIICKLREAKPHTLITSLRQHSLLVVERTFPEPVSMSPRPERLQYSPWYQEDQEGNQVENQQEDQEEDLYMDRGVDLSSDSSLRCGHVTTSIQSAATVTDHSGHPSEVMDQQREEKEQIMKADDRAGRRSLDSKVLEWRKVLERDEGVNLFSVTVAALDIRSVEELSDELALLHTPCHTLLPLQPQDVDIDHKYAADLQEKSNYYMRH